MYGSVCPSLQGACSSMGLALVSGCAPHKKTKKTKRTVNPANQAMVASDATDTASLVQLPS